MKKTVVYNEIGLPVEYLEIENLEKYIYYEKEDFYYRAYDELWLQSIRENTSDVVIKMNNEKLNILPNLYNFSNCNFYLVYENITEIKELDYITIDKTSYEKALNYINKTFPTLENKELNAKLLSSGKKRVKDFKKFLNKGYSLGF